jgi:uncharacterized protein involved in exopolysaccharide biosynthesis
MTDNVVRHANDQFPRQVAVRRRPWLLALGIGVLCAIVVGGPVWLLIGDRYTASAYVRLDLEERPMLGGTPRLFDRERFEVFKSSQQTLVTSKMVLIAALRKPDVAAIPKIQEEIRFGDPVEWLQRRLSVDFPRKAEYMQVSVTRPDPQEAATLVNAVVDAYLINAVDADRRLKQERLNKLENACADKEAQIRTARSELKSLCELRSVGPNLDVLTQRQKMIIEEYSLRNQQKAKMEFDMGDLQAQVAAQSAMLKNIDCTEPPVEEVDAMLHADPMAQELLHELAVRKVRQLLSEDGHPKQIRPPQARVIPSEPNVGPSGVLLPAPAPQAGTQAESTPLGPIVAPQGLLVPPPAAPSTPLPGGPLPGLPDEPAQPAPQKKTRPDPAAKPSRTRTEQPPTSPAEGDATPATAVRQGEQGRTSAGTKAREAERVEREIGILQAALDEARAEATRKVQDRWRMGVAAELTKVQNQYEVKRAQFEKLVKDVDKLREEAQRIGSTTVDIEMLSTELKQKELVAQELDSEREKMRVDLSSAQRITPEERAERPLLPSNTLLRIVVTALAMLTAFCCVAIFVILCDAVARRIDRANL